MTTGLPTCANLSASPRPSGPVPPINASRGTGLTLRRDRWFSEFVPLRKTLAVDDHPQFFVVSDPGGEPVTSLGCLESDAQIASLSAHVRLVRVQIHRLEIEIREQMPHES